MALRLVEMTVSAEHKDAVFDILEKHPWRNFWQEQSVDDKVLVKFILPADDAESVLDAMEKHLSGQKDFRILLLPVEASIPRLEGETEQSLEQTTAEVEAQETTSVGRISREELYSDIHDLTTLSRNFIIMVVLSTLVATIGIARDNVAIVIGAMVIAPLLGPNMAFSLASTLGDTDLGRVAVRTGLTGTLLSVGISIAIGAILTIDPDVREISSRVNVGVGDIVLALAAGAAGALAFTTGMSSALIGVMVAVALLPPLVTVGLLFGSGDGKMALGALLLFLTNMICLNLAGIATFLFQGVRPLSWWEAAVAKKATYRAIVFWGMLLAALIIVVFLSQGKV